MRDDVRGDEELASICACECTWEEKNLFQLGELLHSERRLEAPVNDWEKKGSLSIG